MQLDLLSWTPPNIVRLPARTWGPAIWRPRVERTAFTILAKTTQKAKERYWDQACQGVAGQLRRHGATETEIWAELHAFFAAVDNALSQRSSGGAA